MVLLEGAPPPPNGRLVDPIDSRKVDVNKITQAEIKRCKKGRDEEILTSHMAVLCALVGVM